MTSTNSPIYCNHANEMPNTCPCKKNCYCKKHSCATDRKLKAIKAGFKQNVYILLDTSYSMTNRGFAKPSAEMVNATVARLKALNPLVKIQVARFSVSTDWIGDRPIDVACHTAYGDCTRLYGAIADTIHFAREHLARKEPVLVYVFTDGENNVPRPYACTVSDMIFEAMGSGLFTLAIHCPAGRYKENLLGELRIPVGNVQEWDNVETAKQQLTSGTSLYTHSLSGGTKMSTTTFFVDSSKIDESQLDKVTRKFKKAAVKAETDIATFVSDIMDRPYLPGQAYYMLTKPETVQASKDILLMKLGSAVVYGGPKARAMIGLGSGSAKIKPGNLGEWAVYIQSRSMNRKLVRGTKLLIQKV